METIVITSLPRGFSLVYLFFFADARVEMGSHHGDEIGEVGAYTKPICGRGDNADVGGGSEQREKTVHGMVMVKLDIVQLQFNVGFIVFQIHRRGHAAKKFLGDGVTDLHQPVKAGGGGGVDDMGEVA